jgi:hypothetical protein
MHYNVWRLVKGRSLSLDCLVMFENDMDLENVWRFGEWLVAEEDGNAYSTMTESLRCLAYFMLVSDILLLLLLASCYMPFCFCPSCKLSISDPRASYYRIRRRRGIQ